MTHVWLSLQVTQRSRDFHPEGWNMLHAHLSAHEQKHPLRYSNIADRFVLQKEKAAVIYIIDKLHFFMQVKRNMPIGLSTVLFLLAAGFLNEQHNNVITNNVPHTAGTSTD